MYIEIDNGWFVVLIAMSAVSLVMNIGTFVSLFSIEKDLRKNGYGISKD
jgi:hypothetical protein